MTRKRQAAADERLGMTLRRADQSMLRTKNAALKPIGLTLAQYVALGELEHRPGLTAATLARACQVTPQAIMVVLKALEDQGLIRRSVHSRHPNVLELYVTDPGLEALTNGRELIEPIEEHVTGAFSAEELESLAELLARWIDAFDTAAPES